MLKDYIPTAAGQRQLMLNQYIVESVLRLVYFSDGANAENSVPAES